MSCTYFIEFILVLTSWFHLEFSVSTFFFFPSTPRQKLWEIRKTAHREARFAATGILRRLPGNTESSTRGWENSPWCEEGSPSTIHELQVRKAGWNGEFDWKGFKLSWLELPNLSKSSSFLGFRWQSCDVSVSFLVLVEWKVQREVYPGADGTPGKSWGNNRKARKCVECEILQFFNSGKSIKAECGTFAAWL